MCERVDEGTEGRRGVVCITFAPTGSTVVTNSLKPPSVGESSGVDGNERGGRLREPGRRKHWTERSRSKGAARLSWWRETLVSRTTREARSEAREWSRPGLSGCPSLFLTSRRSFADHSGLVQAAHTFGIVRSLTLSGESVETSIDCLVIGDFRNST